MKKNKDSDTLKLNVQKMNNGVRIMDHREIDILQIIEQNPEISQRKIADETGLSLGMVNLLVKKCIKKGFVKVEGLNSKSMRYILTPQGIKEKTRKTLEYINKSYRAIIKLTHHIQMITETQIGKDSEIWLLGQEDEIYQIIVNTLQEMKIHHQIAKKIEEIEINDSVVIYLWDPEIQSMMEGINYINIVGGLEYGKDNRQY